MRLSAALRLASESIRNWPETTTRCPCSKPLRISVMSPLSRPSFTSTGRNLPSLSATMTTLRLPVEITASVGTSSADLFAAAKSSVANMPGFSSPAGLLRTMRALIVRVVGFTSGNSIATCPLKTLSGMAATRASPARRAWPARPASPVPRR